MLGEKEVDCSFCKLRFNKFFDNLSTEEIASIESIKKCLLVPKGKLLFKEGSYTKGLYFIHTGKVKMYKTGEGGKEQIIRLLNDNHMIGHRALFGREKHSCSAAVIEDCILCFFPVEDFYKLIEKSSKIAMKFAQLLANELRELERKVLDTSQLPIISRLAAAIVDMANEYGYEKDGRTINLQLKRTELAALIGTSRESISRQLALLHTNGCIELVGKKIMIKDKEHLQNIATNIDAENLIYLFFSEVMP